MKKLLIFCVMLTIFMFGCGSETSGTLSVAAPTESNGIVTAKATYTPASGSALSNQKITFHWYAVITGTNTKISGSEETKVVSTNNSGIATSQYENIPTGSYTIYVSASTGDLVNIEGIQSVKVTR